MYHNDTDVNIVLTAWKSIANIKSKFRGVCVGGGGGVVCLSGRV